jgi:predicted GNAT superfamily acetyltransferase
MIVVRSCSGFDEFEACVQLQIDTWGMDATEVMPRKTFFLGQKIGGQVIGAFDTDLLGSGPNGSPGSLIGFAMSLPGVTTGNGRPHPYLHSHMLAVREPYRNRGLGAQLKLKQRLEALSRQLNHMEWTFDPLEIKNSYLNIHKLGTIVRCYHVNFYGVSSSRLQAGLPTDRLVAEWRLNSPRVTAILEGRPAGAFTVEERIEVPASIYTWKASDSEIDRERAMVVQSENRRRFQQAFEKGLAVLGFIRDEEGNGVFELGSLTQAEMD